MGADRRVFFISGTVALAFEPATVKEAVNTAHFNSGLHACTALPFAVIKLAIVAGVLKSLRADESGARIVLPESVAAALWRGEPAQVLGRAGGGRSEFSDAVHVRAERRPSFSSAQTSGPTHSGAPLVDIVAPGGLTRTTPTVSVDRDRLLRDFVEHDRARRET